MFQPMVEKLLNIEKNSQKIHLNQKLEIIRNFRCILGFVEKPLGSGIS
jgi:hypothetical protein